MKYVNCYLRPVLAIFYYIKRNITDNCNEHRLPLSRDLIHNFLNNLNRKKFCIYSDSKLRYFVIYYSIKCLYYINISHVKLGKHFKNNIFDLYVPIDSFNAIFCQLNHLI